MENNMIRITAEECRQLVELTKLGNIYSKIIEIAKQGRISITVPFISETAFKHLIVDGFTIYTMDGTVQLSKYDQDIVNLAKEYEISWEG